MDKQQDLDVDTYWLCSGSLRRRLPSWLFLILATASSLLQRLLPGRAHCEVWIRYRRELDELKESEARLSPMCSERIEALRRHPLSGRDQMRTGLSLWEHGLRTAFIWVEDEEPLCMQWLFLPSDEAKLLSRPGWADLYLPLPECSGHVENIFTFPRGLRRRGGAATEFAHAVFAYARGQGLTRLYTHTHERNLAARRWAERTGWKAYGAIRRYRLDLPLLRRRAWSLHGLEHVAPLPHAQIRHLEMDCRLQAELPGLAGN